MVNLYTLSRIHDVLPVESVAEPGAYDAIAEVLGKADRVHVKWESRGNLFHLAS